MKTPFPRLTVTSLLILGCVAPAGLAQAHFSKDAALEAIKAAPQATESIKASDLQKHLDLLAGPAFAGRLTGTAGQRAAAHYVAKHFKDLGLKPLGDETPDGRSFIQKWPVTVLRASPGTGLFENTGLQLHDAGAWLLPRRHEGKPYAQIRLRGPVRRVLREHMEEATDLEGSIAVVPLRLRPDPEEVNIYSAFREGFGHQAGLLRGISGGLSRSGAKVGVVIVDKMNISFLAWSNMNFLSPGKPVVSQGHGEFKMDRALPPGMQPRIPLLVVAADHSEELLTLLGFDAESIFDPEAKSTRPTEQGQLNFLPELVKTHATNVVAVLPGQGAKKEAIVYSAHMDHVGRAADGSVFNGADDNGSGTSALLEMAEAFAALEDVQRPDRSVIFLSVSGEELGLWGSEFYAKNPSWPLEDTVANINIDMIGRNTEDVPNTAISITPTHGLGAYSTLARDAAFLGQGFDLAMRNGDRFYRRSDHFHFAEAGIPVVFFCDDEHEDYHMPTDTPDKIDTERAARVGKLAFLLGYRTATAEGRPEVLGKREGWFEDN